jgi:hypothetical protein
MKDNNEQNIIAAAAVPPGTVMTNEQTNQQL